MHSMQSGIWLGENVRSLRLRLGFSKVKIAREARISRPTLDRIESGRSNPQLDLVERLAYVFGLTASELLHRPPIGNLGMTPRSEAVQERE